MIRKVALTFLFIVLSTTPALGALPQTCENPAHFRGEACFANLSGLELAFTGLISVVAILAGFASLIMIAVGAFRYMLGQGDPKALGQARATIFWAVAGLVFIVASYLVIGFLIGFLNVPGIGKFCIPRQPGDCGT